MGEFTECLESSIVPSLSASGFIPPQQVEVERLEVEEKPEAGLPLPFG